MEVQAKAPRKGSITDHVRKLTLTTDAVADQKFLAALHAVFLDGGSIQVVSKKPNTPPVTFPIEGFIRYERNHSTTRP